ncbi:MAG: hypothetical protein WB626_02955 [Bacteroidota bacterium]
MTYRHTQWGSVIIIAVLASLFAAVVLLSVRGAAHPAPVIPILLLSGVVLLLLFSSLTVEIRDGALTCRFGVGLIRRTIPLAEIAEARAVRNSWLVGWGIRWVPGSYWLWNVSGLQAVELLLRDGSRFRIGTDEPEELVRALGRGKSRG